MKSQNWVFVSKKGIKLKRRLLFLNFFSIQQSPNVDLIDVPQVADSKFVEDFGNFYAESSENDLIHDVLIKCRGRSFPAHKFVLISRCKFFQSKFQPGICEISLENLNSQIFAQFLTFLYTDSCALVEPGTRFVLLPEKEKEKSAEIENHFEIEKISAQKSKKKWNLADPVKILADMAEKFKVPALKKRLDSFFYDQEKEIVTLRAHRTLIRPNFYFKFNSFPEFQDVKIKCPDGEIFAHKCILAARLDYFKCMFGTNWKEVSEQEKAQISMPLPKNLLADILHYLYTDDLPSLQSCDDTNRVCQLLVEADSFLILRLKEKCEVQLATMSKRPNTNISFLD